MKVLLIDTRKGGDWGLDLLYSGLVRNLGYQNVIDYPSQKKHRMGEPKLVGDHEKDWGAERMSLSYVPEWDLIPNYTHAAVKKMLLNKEIDLIFVDERVESYHAYLELAGNWTAVPVVVVAGHDKFWNVSPDFVLRNYYPKTLKRMFLDNWRPEYDHLKELGYGRPYSWSVNFDHLWDPGEREILLKNKVYDVSFMGYNSHPNRKRYIDHVQKKWSHLRLNLVLEERPNSFGLFINKAEYFKTMAQSRIALNLRGAAENGKAMRFYEIPYVGSFMLSEEFPGKGDTGLFASGFHDERQLDAKIEQYLKDPEAREAMARYCHEDVLKNHTAERRVEQILEDLLGPRATVRRIGRP